MIIDPHELIPTNSDTRRTIDAIAPKGVLACDQVASAILHTRRSGPFTEGRGSYENQVELSPERIPFVSPVLDCIHN